MHRASFAEHAHPQGEEMYDLDDVCSDEFGHYPAGTYIHNPQDFRHTDLVREGCQLSVKLDKFKQSDFQPVVIRPEDRQSQPGIDN